MESHEVFIMCVIWQTKNNRSYCALSCGGGDTWQQTDVRKNTGKTRIHVVNITTKCLL